MKKLTVFLYCTLFLTIIFCLLNISFHLDISLLAFPVIAVFLFFVIKYAYFGIIQKQNIRAIPVTRKLYQYLPYVLLVAFIIRRAGKKGTSYAFDFVSVILWILITVGTVIVLHYMNEKRVYKLLPSWTQQYTQMAVVKYHGFRRVAKEVIEWVDALFWAVFTVMLFQLFVLQLYEIPSESMVPEFLVKDRVLVLKIDSNPKFPLTDIGIPMIKKYKRGDIIVFRNPHYKLDRESEVKTVVSQIIYMLTFSTVNINKDSITGEMKADPLVKRITGVPGEQLMMQDGVLYARTKKTGKFEAVPKDAEFAEWNLNECRSDIKAGIRTFPLKQSVYDDMIACEKERRSLNITEVKKECQQLSDKFGSLCTDQKTVSDVSSLFNDKQMFVYYLLNNDSSNSENNMSVTEKLLTSAGGKQWFTNFMTDWINKVAVYTDTQGELSGARLAGGNLYSDANFKLNLMVKLCIGRLIVRNAQLLKNTSSPDFNTDQQRMDILKNAQKLYQYVSLLDQRNMPVFPANDKTGNPQYIPAGHYFMMGDNRFNSLDMRHSMTFTFKKLSDLDDYSVTYYSNMAPQYVDQSLLLGSPVVRYWPVARVGIPGHTGK